MLALSSLAALLDRFPRASHPYMMVRYWDNAEILGSVAEDPLRKQGFTRDMQGLRLYRQYPVTQTSA
jgi:hypothetical protein